MRRLTLMQKLSARRTEAEIDKEIDNRMDEYCDLLEGVDLLIKHMEKSFGDGFGMSQVTGSSAVGSNQGSKHSALTAYIVMFK